MVKKLVKKIARQFGYNITNAAVKDSILIPEFNQLVDTRSNYVLPKELVTYSHDLLYTFHNCDFMNDARFIRAYEAGKATDIQKVIFNNYEIYWRIHVICWAASQARHLEGDFVDCGVNTGIFSKAVIDYIDFNNTGKMYYLLDTFTGLDEKYSTANELQRELNHAYTANKNTLYEQVKETFRNCNVSIIQGTIPDTLPRVNTAKVAYLSVDMNCVIPEVAALEYFWDKIVKGGIIILDDYGYANAFMDQKNAHDEFAKSKGVEILTLPTCQGMIIKPY